ncbi:hypothetical protein [Lacticaseibacillus kribbianus]|uniref:hypothetical protein n=1 Tax=Lacticaseibacillus kribbianus TaxID=2926292 RepID=UPI001CD75938|nr:hypothetical protein [Lacticaseibacillus kribbianus]
MRNSHTRTALEILCVLAICAGAWLALRPAPTQTVHYRLDSGRIRYDGQAVNAQFDGVGTLTFTNGDRYRGHFKAGRFDGLGTFTSHAGWRYTGHFKAGQVTGTGTLRTGQHSYRGTFKNGKYTRAQAPTD